MKKNKHDIIPGMVCPRCQGTDIVKDYRHYVCQTPIEKDPSERCWYHFPITKSWEKSEAERINQLKTCIVDGCEEKRYALGRICYHHFKEKYKDLLLRQSRIGNEKRKLLRQSKQHND